MFDDQLGGASRQNQESELRLSSLIPFVAPLGKDTIQSEDHNPRRADSTICYFIATLPRSGSWLFAEAMTSTGLAGVPNEYFRPDFVSLWSAKWGIGEGNTFRAYVETAKRITATPNAVFGAKLHWYQFHWMCQQIRNQSGTQLGQSDATRLAEWLPDLKYILLRRRDMARQAISYYRAATTDVWFGNALHFQGGPKEVDYQQVRWFEDVLAEHAEKWDQYFRNNAIKPLEVVYEDFVSDCDATVSAALTYLGVVAPDFVTPSCTTLQRQSDDATEEILQNYLNLRDSLTSKPHDIRWVAARRRFESVATRE